jgi:CubicO group peptidase (beta-lactamase class C family)
MRSLKAVLIAMALGVVPAHAAPRFPEAHWESRDPASLGLEGVWLDRLAEVLGGRGCVIKDGYVVKAWGSQSEIGDWLSSAKPVLSTLLMFAIQEGKVSSPDALIKDFGWQLSVKDQTMTFRRLADMTSGYARPEPPGTAFAYNDYGIQLYQKTLFDRVFREQPEKVANDPRRLGAVGLEDGLQFRPKDRRMFASVRDFARLTWFWLNNGNWNGVQVLPERFFRQYRRADVPVTLPFTKPAETNDYLQVGTHGGGSDQVSAAGPGNYGFNWWFNDMGERLTWPELPRDAFATLGARGNCTFMIPSLNLVLVSADGDWSSFQPTAENIRMHENLRLFMLAVNRTPPSQVSIEQFHPHDFSFSAAVDGNPFDVELAGEFTGPGDERLRVPGFYDGGGVWMIRFSPTRQGDWRMRTISSLKALDGKTESGIWCGPNHNPEIHGGLRVDAAFPHHFIYEDGARYFLLGYEADWLWGADMLDPQRKVMHRLIDQMAARGFNHVMVNVYAHDTRWAPGKSCAWDYGPPALFAWEGTNEDPDHARLNPKFFQVYDGMMEALRDKGIVAHIMLKVYNKKVNWPAPHSRDEERYFRYVVARYQAFPNVVWDFSKESYYEKDDILQSHLIDLIRATDAYHRLTTAHDDDVYTWDPILSRNLDFRTDQQHTDWPQMIAFDRAMRNYPVLNSEFGYEKGVEDLPTHAHKDSWEEQLRRAWLIYMAGGYGVYYYNNTAWDVVKPDPEPPGMQRFQLLKVLLAPLPYWRMEPANQLAVGGPCLALPGEVYVFYAEGSTITVNLRGLESPGITADWVDTWTGYRERAPVHPGINTLKKPDSMGKAPGVLIVRRQVAN